VEELYLVSSILEIYRRDQKPCSVLTSNTLAPCLSCCTSLYKTQNRTSRRLQDENLCMKTNKKVVNPLTLSILDFRFEHENVLFWLLQFNIFLFHYLSLSFSSHIILFYSRTPIHTDRLQLYNSALIMQKEIEKRAIFWAVTLQCYCTHLVKCKMRKVQNVNFRCQDILEK